MSVQIPTSRKLILEVMDCQFNSESRRRAALANMTMVLPHFLIDVVQMPQLPPSLHRIFGVKDDEALLNVPLVRLTWFR